MSINDSNYIMVVKYNDVDINTVGEYDVLYEITIKDELYTCTRKVFVIDDIAPTVTLNAGIDTVVVGTEHVDASVTYFDNLDEELSLEVVSDVDTSVVGSYTIKYIVKDQSDNTTVLIRNVNVVE